MTRMLEARDKNRILQILKQRNVFNPDEITVAMEVLEAALEVRKTADYFAFCARDNNGLAGGYICFGPIPMTDGCYDLYWIAVDINWSGRGVGGYLLCFMENYVKNQGARRIYIETSSTQLYEAARALYDKHGYQQICVLPDFYRPGDNKCIYMKEMS